MENNIYANVSQTMSQDNKQGVFWVCISSVFAGNSKLINSLGSETSCRLPIQNSIRARITQNNHNWQKPLWYLIYLA